MEAISTTQLGQYHLISHLAQGGMSDVYLAQNESTEQLYAIKIVRQEITEDYQHFCREMWVLNRLKHTHILPILDYKEEEDLSYYVTPYIERGSLKERLAAGPLSPEEAGTILAQIGEALQFIHDAGLVHRDIKPANILLDETNYVWLADFGLAKATNTPSDLTRTGCLIGTPSYIAPELLEEPASASSDIYALGVVLYEMLTGAPPFAGETPFVICWKHVYEEPPLPSTRNALTPPAVEQVVMRALEKEPAQRFSTARELVEAYQQALQYPTTLTPSEAIVLDTTVFDQMKNVSVMVRPVGSRVRVLARPQRRLPLAIAVVMLAILFLLSAVSLAIEYQTHSPVPASIGAQMITQPDQRPGKPVIPTTTAQPSQTDKANGSLNRNAGGEKQSNPHKHKPHGDDN